MAKKGQTFEFGFSVNLDIVGGILAVAIMGILFMFGGLATVRDEKEHNRNAEIFDLLIVGLICTMVVLGASVVLMLDSLI